MPNRIDANSVRQRLRTLRLERGLTQDAIAERFEISSKHYQDLELGRKGFNPNFETLNGRWSPHRNPALSLELSPHW
jgi:DNA-binding XRE family transcriptional regulator